MSGRTNGNVPRAADRGESRRVGARVAPKRHEVGRSPGSADALVTALGGFVDARMKAQTSKQESPDTVVEALTLLTLFELAVLLAVVLWQLGDVAAHPALALLEKIVPTVLGAAFVAYADQLRSSVIGLCDRPWVRCAVAGVLLAVVTLLAIPFAAPIWIPEFATLTVDGRDVVLRPPRSSAGPYWIQVGGFREHALHITERSEDNAPAAVTYEMGRWDLLLGTWQRIAEAFGRTVTRGIVLEAPTTVLVATGAGASEVAVTGHFPALFLRAESTRRTIVTSSAGREIWYRVTPNRNTHRLELPEGIYQFRFMGKGRCVTAPVTQRVEHMRTVGVDLQSAVCAPPAPVD